MKNLKKQYGQFFTEPRIAEMMVRWAIKNNPSNFLDPAAGAGIFTRTAYSKNSKIQLTATELEKNMARRFTIENRYPTTLVETDYLLWNPSQKFDAIVANPPYNKFQEIPNRALYAKKFISDYGVRLSGYTNQCIFFLIKSINELSAKGRCCYLIPYEFLNTGYGEIVKKYLIQSRMLKGILKFKHQEKLFTDALTTSCILFIENNTFDGCYFIESPFLKNLQDFDFDEAVNGNLGCFKKYDELDPAEKWLGYFEQQGKKATYKNLIRLEQIGKVKRGIATGNNDFFTLNRSKITELGLSECTCIPCVTKSPDVKSCIFDRSEFERLALLDKKLYLFDGNKAATEKDGEYIHYGESMAYNKTYLTRHRTPWYSMEDKPAAPIWFSVFNRNKVKVVRNTANVKNLTTFHGFYPNDLNEPEINILFCYLLTPIALSILKQNKREYGSGLDKFEPGDLNKSYVLNIKALPEQTKQEILVLYEKLKGNDCGCASIINSLNEIFSHFLA